MELYYILSIVDRKKAKDMLDIHNSLQLSAVFTKLGQGTATAEYLSLYDLEPSEKAVIGTIAGSAFTKRLIREAEKKLYIDIPGNGVMMAIPIKSVGGGQNLAYLIEGQTIGGAIPDMNFEHELIIVILNEGYSDFVMDAARNAGATGGTVLHAKGTGKSRSEKFHKVSLAEEKDMIYILATSKKKAEIMKAINRDCGTNTKTGAICFSLPVSEVAGIRRLDEE